MLRLGALVIVRATVLIGITVVGAEGLTAVAYYSSETELFLAASSGTGVAFLLEETSGISKRGW